MPEHRQERAASAASAVPAVAREPQYMDRHPDRQPDYAQSVEYRKGTSRGAARLPHGFVLEPHSHTRGQLVYAASGALATATARGTWVAPANRVTWTPPRFAHSHRFYGETDVRLLTVPLDLCGQLVDHPSVFAVSPLLREALLALTGGKERRPGAHGRLLAVLVDELADAAEQSLHLPEASDDRLRTVTALLHEDPARPATLAALGRTVGASERTLSRLFHAELGMSFHRWRTTLRIHHALAHLAAGLSVTDTAVVCGWSNPSTFIDAFTEMVGQTPGRYRAGLRGARS
ncbi:AraC-like DNA-binding protein [Streptomyces sp. B3I7]|uniref:AraC family transcriptional regulator n=1 Tax=Streptomyces sp. B3I7 TaxID=3042269 RepID=UPI00278170B4|nr:helix-turn-helix transcriptional regulator [Streptomyces sp. B3I7]MDQ0813745.1 AraC-like DNA-binding protein [Streptomyces sp. B3I7]